MASLTERATAFGAVAADYDRLRPGPPEEAIRWILPPSCETAVDLGAGTGLATRVIAQLVPRVVAVEPDERMRRQFRARSPEAEVLDGRAEAIPLPDGFVDAVLVCSAWHWVDPDRALPEIARVLRPGGRLGVLWSGRDREVDWVQEISAGPADRAEARIADPYALDRSQRRLLKVPDGGAFEPSEYADFPFTREMSPEDLLAWLGTHSAVILAPAERRGAYLSWVRGELERRFGGADLISVPMRSGGWRANRRPD